MSVYSFNVEDDKTLIKYLTSQNLEGSDYINFLCDYLETNDIEKSLFLQIVETFYKKCNLRFTEDEYPHYKNLLLKMINKGLLSVDPEYHGSVLCSVANKYYNDEFASPLTREDSRIHLKPRTNAFFFLVKNSVCFMVNGINAVNCYDVNFGTT